MRIARRVRRGLGFAVAPALLVGASLPRSADPPARASVEATARLYAETCSGCHGTRAAPGGRGPNLFDGRLSARSDDELDRVLRHGITGTEMPAFGDMLDEGGTRRMIAFLRAEVTAPPPAPPFIADPHGRVVRSERQGFRVEVVARGLATPWGLAFLPDGRLLVTERPGRLRIVENGKLRPEPVGGVPKVWAEQDGGLMDVAVGPDGAVYLSYSEPAPGARSMTVIARGRLGASGEWVRDREVFRAPDPLYTASNSHYGSRLAFDARGHLFFTIGDRGVMSNAQDLRTPLGKIHRVNADGSIPADNPFIGRAGAVASIWSYGHRNPQGLSWDPATGLLWASEHGPSGGDELNVIERGANYGWGVVTMGRQAGLTAREAPGMVNPAVHYTPRIAPSGILFYRGKRYPGWRDHLLVGGLAGQQLRRVEVADRRVVHQETVFDSFGRVRTMAVGPDGLLYVLLQTPTGRGTGLLVSDPSPGMLVRLQPLPADRP